MKFSMGSNYNIKRFTGTKMKAKDLLDEEGREAFRSVSSQAVHLAWHLESALWSCCFQGESVRYCKREKRHEK